MPRILKPLSVLLILLVIAIVGAFLLIPDRFQQIWRQVGLPDAPLIQAQTLLGRTPLAAPTELRLYGQLEAEMAYAMSELPGRVAEVLAEEGDTVVAGQPLLRLDAEIVLAQIAAAEQAVLTAQAASAAVAAPPPQTAIAVADSAIAAAQTRLDNARRSLAQAQQLLDNPIDLEAEINRVRALLPAAQAGVSQAEAQAAQVRVRLEAAQSDGSREGQFTRAMLERQQAAAAANIDAAKARLTGQQRTLRLLQAMRLDLIGQQALVNVATQDVRLAEAGLRQAHANRAVVAAAPTPETIAIAEAQVQTAQADLELARWQADHMTVPAPRGGRILERLTEPGETASPGAPLFAIADVSQMQARVYVALLDLPHVHVGDTLPVETPALPGQRLRGTVNFIAAEAQFRPDNALNPEDRGDMVFLVKLSVSNPDGQLKPGMPVDVLLPLTNSPTASAHPAN